jgi:hypothetical protein
MFTRGYGGRSGTLSAQIRDQGYRTSVP